MVQKQGQRPMDKNVLPLKAATEGGIKYIPDNRASDDDKSKTFCTEKNIND